MNEHTRSKHILIIDDSPDQRLLMKTLLESRGYTTQCTSNGKEALKLLHSAQKMPETILLDLDMPIMGGLDFRAIQLEDTLLRHIPVVVISGEENVTNTRKKSKADVIKKPLSVSVLIEALERIAALPSLHKTWTT